jgi:hypothetical protein
MNPNLPSQQGNYNHADSSSHMPSSYSPIATLESSFAPSTLQALNLQNIGQQSTAMALAMSGVPLDQQNQNNSQYNGSPIMSPSQQIANPMLNQMYGTGGMNNMNMMNMNMASMNLGMPAMNMNMNMGMNMNMNMGMGMGMNTGMMGMNPFGYDMGYDLSTSTGNYSKSSFVPLSTDDEYKLDKINCDLCFPKSLPSPSARDIDSSKDSAYALTPETLEHLNSSRHIFQLTDLLLDNRNETQNLLRNLNTSLTQLKKSNLSLEVLRPAREQSRNLVFNWKGNGYLGLNLQNCATILSSRNLIVPQATDRPDPSADSLNGYSTPLTPTSVYSHDEIEAIKESIGNFDERLAMEQAKSSLFLGGNRAHIQMPAFQFYESVTMSVILKFHSLSSNFYLFEFADEPHEALERVFLSGFSSARDPTIGGLRIGCRNKLGISTVAQTSDSAIETDLWVSIVAQVDSQGTLRIWINDDLEAVFDATTAPSRSIAQMIAGERKSNFFGSSYNEGSERSIHATVRELRVWNYALEHDEIDDLIENSIYTISLLNFVASSKRFST